MKTSYSITIERSGAEAGDFYINGASCPEEEEEKLGYSSISLLPQQLYGVIAGTGSEEVSSGRALLSSFSSPALFSESEAFLKALQETEAAVSGLSILKNRLLVFRAGNGGLYRIRQQAIVDLLSDQAENAGVCFGVISEDGSLPGDLYIICSSGVSESLGSDRILRICQETDRIQEIASALLKASRESGNREAASSVIAVRRDA